MNTNLLTSQTQVLLLTSNRVNGSLIENHLEALDYKQIVMHENANEALSELQTNKYSMLLVDHESHSMDGWSFIREVRHSKVVRDIPIVFFGSRSTVAKKSELAQYGVTEFLSLPCTVKQVARTIEATQLILKSSGTIENKFARAKDALIDRNPDMAVEIYTEISSKGHSPVRSTIGMSHAHIQKNNPEQAVKLLETLASEHAEFASDAYLVQMTAYFSQKNYTQVQNIASRMISLPNPNLFHVVSCAEELFSHGQFQTAELVCRTALAQGLDHAEFFFVIAKCLLEVQNFDQALLMVDTGILRFGASISFLNLKGIAYRKLDRVLDAKEAYEKAATIKRDFRVLYNLALCEVVLGRIEEAKNILKEVISIEPTFDKAKDKLASLK